MEKRYLSDVEYASMIDLSEIYLDIVEANKDRNSGKLDEDGRVIDGLLTRINRKIHEREDYLRRMECLAKRVSADMEITAEAN